MNKERDGEFVLEGKIVLMLCEPVATLVSELT